jgi:3-oxoacyl-[acyl-carrier protein] reductase
MNLNIKNKTVVIIGASKGIGLYISKSFLNEGAVVHCVSRFGNKLVEKQLKSKFKKKVFFYNYDATVEKQVLDCSNKIGKLNNIDILVCNVGSGRFPNESINSSKLWSESWAINFDSALNSVRAFKKYISNGSILFISSIAGNEFINAPTDYSVAKSSLISLTKILSNKLAPEIRVNSISPGNIFIKDGTWDIISRENPKKVKKILKEKVPLKRFGKPEEVADLVTFISSDRASFITGSCYIIDGGQTLSF